MHVYVIQKEAGPIKIGFSKNPRRRLDDLQRATPDRLFIRHSIVATNGPRIERGAHAILVTKAIGNEWFDASIEEAISAIKEAQKFATRGQSIERRGSMTAQQYRDAIRTIGLNQAKAGEFLGVSPRTSQDYALGQSNVPDAAAKLLRLMILWRLSPDDVPA